MGTRLKNIRSLLVDDNRFNAAVLSDTLAMVAPYVEVVGIAESGADAIEKIGVLSPDIVFLDVEMPDMNGFEVLAALDSIDFQTIFVTAHSHYAIQAIRFNALDYLVKPIVESELLAALSRYQSNENAFHHHAQIQAALENRNAVDEMDKVLYLPTQEGGMKMLLRHIVKLEGDRNYTQIYLSNGQKKISSKTLGYFDEILSGNNFFRSHRSVIVNYVYIDRLADDHFILKSGSDIPISRRRKAEAKRWFVREV